MKLLNAQEVLTLLEDAVGRTYYEFVMVGEGADIENSNHKELYIYLYNESDLAKVKEALAGVLNVMKLVVSGQPDPATTDVPTLWNIVLGG
jgi:hypothetical protein